MQDKILLVDDSERVTSAIQRALRQQFAIDAFNDPAEALQAVMDGTYAVAVADLQMPGMSGIRFLGEVKEHSPDTIRLMLTGQADLEAAINAVNQGGIFRFLTKPCPVPVLGEALADALRQYRLVMAERQLLEQTLKGSIEVLTEAMALIHPTAFARSHRIARYMRHMADRLALPGRWQYEAAGLLAQIGCITLPLGTLDKVNNGEALTAEEQALFSDHPHVAARLIERIPRLETVTGIISRQHEPGELSDDIADAIRIGAPMLRLAIEFDRHVSRGLTAGKALFEVSRGLEQYDRRLIDALATVPSAEDGTEQRRCRIQDLRPAMIVDHDVRAANGFLVMAKGEPVTRPALERLKTIAAEIGVAEPIRVRVPVDHDGVC